MLSYRLKCKKNTKNTNPVVSKTSNGKTMILSKCAIKNKKQKDKKQRKRSKRINK